MWSHWCYPTFGTLLSKLQDIQKSQSIDKKYGEFKVCTVGEIKDLTNRSIWSKTNLITSSVGGAGVDPPFFKS